MHISLSHVEQGHFCSGAVPSWAAYIFWSFTLKAFLHLLCNSNQLQPCMADCCPDDLLCVSLHAEEVQPTEALTVNRSDLASLSTNTLFPDSSAANPFKLFIWKKYAFIIVFLITPNR